MLEDIYNRHVLQLFFITAYNIQLYIKTIYNKVHVLQLYNMTARYYNHIY